MKLMETYPLSPKNCYILIHALDSYSRRRRPCTPSSSGTKGPWGICCWRGRPSWPCGGVIPEPGSWAWAIPSYWRLLVPTLSLDGVWDSGESSWASLFAEGPLSPELQTRLARFQLALVFGPRPTPRCRGACAAGRDFRGLPGTVLPGWWPRVGGGRAGSASGQVGAAPAQCHFSPDCGLGLAVGSDPNRISNQSIAQAFQPVRRRLKPAATKITPGRAPACGFFFNALPGSTGWLAVAPGSGQPRKNWPLAPYYELSPGPWPGSTSWGWCGWRVPPKLPGFPISRAWRRPRGTCCWPGRRCTRVAAVLSRCRLFLGNDSGLTHLAAALGGPGPSPSSALRTPRSGPPPGQQVRVLRAPCHKAPCARGREIPCPRVPMPGGPFSAASHRGGRGDFVCHSRRLKILVWPVWRRRAPGSVFLRPSRKISSRPADPVQKIGRKPANFPAEEFFCSANY